MLTAPLIRRRAASLPWLALRPIGLPAWRHLSSESGGRGRGDRRRNRFNKEPKHDVASADTKHGTLATSGPSLLEQLFPEETKRYQEQEQQDSRPDIPRLPMDTSLPRRPKEKRDQQPATDDNSSGWRRTLELQKGQEPTLLLLRNASKNLVEEDFRRLIPQGLHVEGWALEQGDILKVIPNRELATLEHQSRYYLLFSNALSANAYQEHVTRVHRLAALHTPADTDSPIMPPPGIISDGLDVNAAIASYSLIPPTQKLVLRMLRPPLTPMLEGLIRNRGYHSIVNRPDKSPFEARLTLEGPQLSQSSIRNILHISGKERALSWSGGTDIVNVRLAKWEARNANPSDSNSAADDPTRPPSQRTEAAQMSRDVAKSQGIDITAPFYSEDRQKPKPRSTLNDVYIVGFNSQEALQTFVGFWHRRPMDPNEWRKGGSKSGTYNEEAERDEESAPVAKVEVLW